MKTFNVEITISLSENDYISIYKHKIDMESPKYKAKFYYRLAIAIIFALLCFLNMYTVILGVFIISFYMFILFEQNLLPIVEKYRYRNRRYLQEKITYTISNKVIIMNSKSIDIKTKWSSVYSWHKRGNWLIISFYDIPRVHLPVEELVKSKIFEQVMSFVKRYGKEYK